MMLNKNIWRIFAGLIFVMGIQVHGSESCQSKKGADTLECKKPAGPDMQWWRDAKFGLFIHWGPVSIKGKEISWSRKGPRRGDHREGKIIPAEEYDNLYKQFNPVKFDAKSWVKLAKDAGMKYLVFTAKHHDNFSMFDTKMSEYKITNSPFKRDVCKELAEACHQGGIRLGWYHSGVDWVHPDFGTENHKRYVEFYLGQIRELCTNYGKVSIWWFDGYGRPNKVYRQLWGDDLKKAAAMLRQLQPGILLNPRGGTPGDYGTWEQKIGVFNKSRPWEACITIGTQWAWKPNDNIKSLKECLQTLVQVVGGDGNLLFNVGPMPTGEIEAQQAQRLREMGQWLKKYGESIYSTRGGPFKRGAWGASTYRNKTIYVHVLDWQGKDEVTLPAIPIKIEKVTVLTGGKAKVEQAGDVIKIAVPKENQQDIDTIIKLEIDEPVEDIEPV